MDDQLQLLKSIADNMSRMDRDIQQLKRDRIEMIGGQEEEVEEEEAIEAIGHTMKIIDRQMKILTIVRKMRIQREKK